MANALTLSAVTAGTAVPAAGLLTTTSSANGASSASIAFANGASGAGDTIANAQLLAATTGRLNALLAQSYATVAAMNQAFAAAGLEISYPNGAACSALAFTNAAPGVPTATVTTSAATGYFRLAIAHSATA